MKKYKTINDLADKYSPLTALVVLMQYYLWCKENGIEKGSVKRFAKENGILLK